MRIILKLDQKRYVGAEKNMLTFACGITMLCVSAGNCASPHIQGKWTNMAKSATKKPSNVTPFPSSKKGANKETDFAFSGDVMPIGGNPEKDRVSFNGVFDFAGVDMVDLYRMAAQTMVIKLAGNCRQKFAADTNKDKAKKIIKAFPVIVKETIPTRINVKEDIVSKLRSTSSANAVEKLGSKIEKLSPAQKEALRKLLNVK